jgi:hypothetical protein
MNVEEDAELLADLDAALDANKPPAEQEAAPEGETAEQSEERLYKREGRRFVAKEQEAAKAGEKPEQQAEQQPAAAKPWKPTWYKDEYGPWDKLSENFRVALRDQERNAATAIEKHSTAAKAWEPVAKQLEPYTQQLAAAGLSSQQYVANLINADGYLRQSPIEALQWLCQSYTGKDLIALADEIYNSGQQVQQSDPVQQELAQLKQKISHLETLPQQQAREAWDRQIADWAKDKPDFAAVKPFMADLAKRMPDASLDELYAEAQWAHPDTRERILKQREDKRLDELKRARAVGAQSPRGGQTSGAARPSRPTMSLEEEIGTILDGGV